MKISKRVQNITASQSLEMAARCRRMREAGINVISMSVGEPDFDTPEHIRRAAQDAIENHWSHYGAVAGIPTLRQAVAAQQNSRSGNAIRWEGEDVIVSVGAKMAIFDAIQALINPGDEVIIPVPAWVSYCEMVRLAEGTVVEVPTRMEERYCLTPDQLRAAITPRTRLLILCSPNNPTGSIYSRETLDALVEVLRDWPDVTVLSDEIYSQLVYAGECVSFGAYPELADRLVLVNGVSKSYAMTGYRIGWLMSKNKAFVSGCTRLQGQQLTCATMVAQRAAEAALTGPQDCVVQMREAFDKRRLLICNLTRKIKGFRFDEPQGAFYLFPDVRQLFSARIPSADALVEYLLQEAHVATVSGAAFGCPDCIRLSYATSSDEIIEAMNRIYEAIDKL